MPDAAALVRHLVGARYGNRGRGPDYDCYGLVLAAGAALGREYPDYLDGYAMSDEGPQAAVTIVCATGGPRSPWQRVPVLAAGAGDVIVFRVGKFACHVGLYLGDGSFIHALAGRNVSIERLRGDWERRMAGVYRHA